MPAPHHYRATVVWTGDEGVGTRDYRAYRRDHIVRVEGKPDLPGSSGLAPRSDPARYNPDELLVASLAACHMLWYLHLAANAGVVVRAYEDPAEGTLVLEADGGGRFTEVVLHPRVRIDRGDPERARALHEEAHRKCFIASSVNFPVRLEPTIEVGPTAIP
jgi:organic hydroperoxide reductase OsmC/OhrA